MVDDAKPVHIDVGGFIYATTLQTLKKSPVLNRLMSQHNSNDVLFVDRDGGAFAYVLNFLRNGTVIYMDDRNYIEFLIIEAGFFGLKRMESQLSNMLTHKRNNEIQELVFELRSIRLLIKSLVDNEKQRPPSRQNSSSHALHALE